MGYQIFTDATADLNEDLLFGLPNVEIIPVDTLCASVGEGFLVREALKRQAEGMNIEELAKWVTDNCQEVCHWFSVDTFEHLKHGGRVSNATAVAGSVLNIKPLLHVDEEGKLKVVEKPRGQKQALKAKLTHMKEGWNPEQGNFVIVGHGDCLERAEECRQKVLEQHPEADVHIAEIGPVIGSHTGPGILAIIYWGNNR